MITARVGSRWWSLLLLFAVTALVLTTCSSDDAGDGAPPEADGSPTTTARQTLRVLVTNDDGVAAEGIDALVEALRSQPGVEVTVVAPAENKSGSGSDTTPGALVVTDTTTTSGYPAKAVDGFPADTIVWAFDQGGVPERPDLVISGINAGQNIGPAVPISGTVGAAKAAVARGVPALAVSQGLADPPDFPAAVAQALSWLQEHRGELLAGTAPLVVVNLNVPTCPVGAVRGVVESPVASDPMGRNALEVDCNSSKQQFTDDMDAFINGYAVISEVAA